MTASPSLFADSSRHTALLRGVTRPIPVPLINILLDRILKRIVQRNPFLFARLQGHHHKSFLIDITNLPFSLMLHPNPSAPQLTAHRKDATHKADAKISGTLLTLLGMVDGRYDGDALFFTRDLQVTGDTEAIVCLRNAMDDMDGSVATEAAAYFGPLGHLLLDIARRIDIHDKPSSP